MSLVRYRAKRKFNRTPEPVGKVPSRGDRGATGAFVVQKHAARNLHYDFRLEIEGTLKSWAVPKGFPVAKGEKRLAMQVEDHPIEYGDFEGVIPAGNYGAGSVMLWDRGEFHVFESDPGAALRRGKLALNLDGKKLRGEWTLVRMRARPNREANAWLLIKTGQAVRSISKKADDNSVKSGRSMRQIASARDREWISNKSVDTKPKAAKSPARIRTPRNQNPTPVPELRVKQLPAATPDFVSPMKAAPDEALPTNGNWLLEVKLDGIRAIGVKTGKKLSLFSRRPKDISVDYPEVITAREALPVERVVVDGEIVALDEKGRSSFQLLQNLKRTRMNRPPVYYYLFDLLHIEGHDLKAQPLMQRKAALELLMESAEEPLRLSVSL